MILFDVYSSYDISPVKARDVFVYDSKGVKYLDLYGGHAVISIGHTHPHYVKALREQLANIGFYSNAVINPLQQKLAEKLGALSGCDDYQLFLCNSGAEANENALKIASFVTGKSKIIAFKNGFHGRTSAAVAASDNPGIQAPINLQHEVTFLDFGDLESLEKQLSKGNVAAVIFECIQGIGGLDRADPVFYNALNTLCEKYHCMLIADEVQSGYGRTGSFFAYQKYQITPHLITVAKGMGNGFPIGGVLIHPSIKAQKGLLGTTFGGNHLACTAAISVLEVIEKDKLVENVNTVAPYFFEKADNIDAIKQVKGAGFMLGLEFEFEVAKLRKKLLFDHCIFTGSSNNKNLLRILPPLSLKPPHIDQFFNALKKELL